MKLSRVMCRMLFHGQTNVYDSELTFLYRPGTALPWSWGLKQDLEVHALSFCWKVLKHWITGSHSHSPPFSLRERIRAHRIKSLVASQLIDGHFGHRPQGNVGIWNPNDSIYTWDSLSLSLRDLWTSIDEYWWYFSWKWLGDWTPKL